MAISPSYVGETADLLAFTWTLDDGSPYDLTGKTLHARLNSTLPNEPAFDVTGQITVTSAPTGGFTYAPSEGDMALPRLYQLQFRAIDNSTQLVKYARPVIWRINRPL